jgi:hypothetical protein
VNASTTETVRETVKDTLEDARERFGDVRDLIAPKAAETLAAVADRLTPDELGLARPVARERRLPRWLLIAGVAAAAAGVLVVVSRMRGRTRQEWPSYDTSRFPNDVPAGEPVDPDQKKVDRTVAIAKSAVSDAVAEASDELTDAGGHAGS